MQLFFECPDKTDFTHASFPQFFEFLYNKYVRFTQPSCCHDPKPGCGKYNTSDFS